MTNLVRRTMVFAIFISLSDGVIAEEDFKPSVFNLWGFSFTPGIGARVISLSVSNPANPFQSGILTNNGSFWEPTYASLDVESPEFFLNDHIGLSIRNHSSKFELSRQEFTNSNSYSSQNTSDFASVGTRVKGYYTYVMPSILLRIPYNGTGRYYVISGYGWWKSWYQGNISFASNEADALASEKFPISSSTRGSEGWMIILQGREKNSILEIGLGGASWYDSQYKVNMAEANIQFGYRIQF